MYQLFEDFGEQWAVWGENSQSNEADIIGLELLLVFVVQCVIVVSFRKNKLFMLDT